MKKLLLIVVFLCFGFTIFPQKKFVTKTGVVSFEASVPNFEEVKAKNEAVTITLNTDGNEIAGLILIKGFRFKIALMEEHFNYNYLESNSYPKATFKGIIENFDPVKLSSLPMQYNIIGKIKIHGKTKKIAITAWIKKITNGYEVASDFNLNTDDFDIEIPNVVSKKVSKNVFVQINAVLK